MIISMCGNAGSGKDTSAAFLVKNHRFVQISLADKIKQICKDVFDFSEEQLWGSSSKRNEPDERYLQWTAVVPHRLTESGLRVYHDGRVPQYLTPRHALQQLGTEWGRACYKNVWVDNTMRTAHKLLSKDPNIQYVYSPYTGLSYIPRRAMVPTDPSGVVISDVRFYNELCAVRNAGGKVIRLTRATSLVDGQQLHESELELNTIPLTEFDAIIDNADMSLEQLEIAVACTLETLLAKSRDTLNP